MDQAVKRYSIWCFLYNSCNKTWLRTQHGWSPVCAYPTEIAPVKIFRFKEFCKFLHYIFTFCRLFKRLTKQEFLLQILIMSKPYKARICEQNWTSVDSSSWILNSPALLISCITSSLMSSDSWEIGRCTVLFESEIVLTFLALFSLKASFTIVLAHGKINSSPIVWGFFFFAISRDTRNDASTTAAFCWWKEPLASSRCLFMFNSCRLKKERSLPTC